MKRNKIYSIILILLVLVAAFGLWYMNDTRRDIAIIKETYGANIKVELMKEVTEDPFIQDNFPGLEKVYSINGVPAAFITSGTGYEGTIRVLVVIDAEKKETLDIRILEQGDTPFYADPIMEPWFTNRFKGHKLMDYLNLVKLDPEKPTDIVQVTGATVSSQAVVNNVNTAIGAWNYLVEGIEKDPVDNFIPLEMWEKDENSFMVSWPEGSFRVTTADLEKYEKVTVDTILQKTTGTKIKLKASGPLLVDLLKDKGIDIHKYEAIGITGRDNYYAFISKDIIENRDIILGMFIDGEEIPREEKPVKIVIPEEMGVYWVKMVNRIDLYPNISPKNIQNVHIFDTLVEDIQPYYYEYFGSRDESYLVGKILQKFDFVDPNGFFTMVGADGLVKNETINMVSDRYYIKVGGENAPMNIGPAFKLGMNVKEMSHFSTTIDAVIFPRVLVKVLMGGNVKEGEGANLLDVLETAGMVLDSENYVIKYMDDQEFMIKKSQLNNAMLIPREDRTDIQIDDMILADVSKISKINH